MTQNCQRSFAMTSILNLCMQSAHKTTVRRTDSKTMIDEKKEEVSFVKSDLLTLHLRDIE